MTTVNCKYHTVSVTYRWVHRRGGITMTKQKLEYSGINLFSCHYIPYKSQATRETGFQLTRWALAWPGSNADSGKDTLIHTKLKARVLHYISGSNCCRIVYLCQTIQAISKVCNWYVEFKLWITVTSLVEHQFIFSTILQLHHQHK